MSTRYKIAPTLLDDQLSVLQKATGSGSGIPGTGA